MKYRQIQKEDGSYELVEVVAPTRAPLIVGGDFEPYKSPIDGTIITSARQHEDHKRRHGVVEQREFGTEHWERKAKERERLYSGEHTSQQKLARKRQINEIINHYMNRA